MYGWIMIDRSVNIVILRSLCIMWCRKLSKSGCQFLFKENISIRISDPRGTITDQTICLYKLRVTNSRLRNNPKSEPKLKDR
jgi:hypothetical protein